MMVCPYCGPVEPQRTTYEIKKPERGTLDIDWCPTCTACLNSYNEKLAEMASTDGQ